MKNLIILFSIAILSPSATAGYLYWDVETTDVQNYTVRLIAKDFEQFNNIEIGKYEGNWYHGIDIKLDRRRGVIDNIIGPPNYREDTAKYGEWNSSQYTMHEVYFSASGYQEPTGTDVIFAFDVSGADFLDTVQIIGDFYVQDKHDGSMNDYQGTFADYDLDIITLPEPSTIALLGIGGLLIRRRKRG